MNKRLLILDDEAGILDSYRIILSPDAAPAAGIVSSRSRGGAAAAVAAQPQAQALPQVFELTCVSRGEDALEEIKKATAAGTPFAGGFFDVKLGPGIDGIETIRQAKDIDTQMSFVMVTAYQDRNVDEIAKIFGPEFAQRWDFMSKPFSRNEIIQKAQNLVANWDARKREKEYLEQIEAQQAQLIRSERLAAVGTLARGIGHEFGNILLGIIGKADLARAKNTPEAMVDALQVIAKSAHRAGVITRNLQTLVKTQTKREPADLTQVLKECFQLVEYELRKGQIELVENYPASLKPVSVNRVEIGQIFLNLTINAVHSMAEKRGGKLTVTAKETEAGVTVDFEDTGCGIPAENLTKIFTPLFTTKEEGSGIGLSVSKKIVDNHGGKLAVKSEVGKGTVFRIFLPFVPPTPIKPPADE